MGEIAMITHKILPAAILLAALASAGPAHADGTIKVGVIAQFSGTFADFGEQISHGIDTYMREHGDTVDGKKIEILKRDQAGPNPDRAKQLAQELVTRDKVDFIAGIDFTPTALAIAPVITETKKPTVIMNAATIIIPDRSPYFVRFSSALDTLEEKFGEWSAKNGIKNSYVVVSDYVAGHAAGDAFKKSFIANGGTILGETGVPLEGLDLAAYVQKIADLKPQSVFVFLSSTKQSVVFSRLFVETGRKAAGTKLLGGTDLFEASPAAARAAPDDAIGAYSVQNYSWTLDTPLNQTYVKDYAKYFGTELHPDFMSVSAYDGMEGIYRVIAKLNGDIDGDKAMAAFKGLAFESPRGPISIDPASRDVVQPIYIRQVVREKGELINKEIYTFPNVPNRHN
jgi:branched-chain amino acid transport system substrate-binding protein